jgi:hypothetical protein
MEFHLAFSICRRPRAVGPSSLGGPSEHEMICDHPEELMNDTVKNFYGAI